MNIVNSIRNYNAQTLNVSEDPRTGAGAQAGINSIAIDPNSNMYKKTGTGVNDWQLIVKPSFETAYNVYVATTGSDIDGDGTQSKPWRTLVHAMDEVAGLTSWYNRYMINMAPGEYHEVDPINPLTAPVKLIGNIGIQSEGWNDSVFIYFDYNLVLDPVTWVTDDEFEDPRSAFINVNIQMGPSDAPSDPFASSTLCTLDFAALGPQGRYGKIYFNTTAIRSPLTVIGDNVENHAFFDGCFFYRDLILQDLSVLITNSNDIFAEDPYKFFISTKPRQPLPTVPPVAFFKDINVICISSWFKHVIVQPPYITNELDPYYNPRFTTNDFFENKAGGIFCVLDLEVHDLEIYGDQTYVQATASSIPSNIPNPDVDPSLQFFSLEPKFVLALGATCQRLNDANALAYLGTVPSDWNPEPTTVQEAIDQLASRTKALEIFDYDQTVYVSKNGVDAVGRGGQHEPYLTISYAMSQITDAAPSKRYVINVANGSYEENTLYIKPSVFIHGESIQGCSIFASTGGIILDPSFTGAGDYRSGFNNVKLRSPVNIDFFANTSNEGKIYINNCWVFTSTTVSSYNSVNQFVCENCLFFFDITAYGTQVQFQDCLAYSTTYIYCSLVDGSTFPFSLYNSTLGDVVAARWSGVGPDPGNTLSVTNIEAYNSSITGSLSLNDGANITCKATADFLPLKSKLTLLGGTSITLVNDAYGLAYTPAILANWSGIAPTSVSDALDRIAAMIGPIP